MKEQDMLYFEEDDASGIGLDGKQVFVAKRINGKTSRNKANNDEMTFNNKESVKTQTFDSFINRATSGILDEETFIGIEKKKDLNNKSKVKEKKDNRETKDKNNDLNKKKKVKKTKKKKNQTKKTQKKNVKKKKGKKVSKIFILLIIVIVAIVFALVSPIFSIQKIEVKGNERVSENTVISLSGLEKGKNIFQNLKSKIVKNIKENQYLEEVEVHRILPSTIEIKVKERQIDYQINVIDSYVYLDSNGYILETSSVNGNVPIIEGLVTSEDNLLNKNRVDKEDWKYLNKISRILDSAKNLEIDKMITKITLKDGKYILYLKSEEKYVYLGDANDITNKMLYLITILENEKGKKGKIILDGNINEGFKPRFREE